MERARLLEWLGVIRCRTLLLLAVKEGLTGKVKISCLHSEVVRVESSIKTATAHGDFVRLAILRSSPCIDRYDTSR